MYLFWTHRALSCYPLYQSLRAKVKPRGMRDAQAAAMEPSDIMIFEVIIGLLLLGYQSTLCKYNPKEMNSFMPWILGTSRIGKKQNLFKSGPQVT